MERNLQDAQPGPGESGKMLEALAIPGSASPAVGPKQEAPNKCSPGETVYSLTSIGYTQIYSDRYMCLL